MTTTPRNASCPCGSGQKYKLCCLSADGGTPPTSAAEVASKAVRTKAFDKLAAFGARPAFNRDLERAFEAFWSPLFQRRGEDERVEAYRRDRAEGGEVTYFTLDAPTALGKTIVEHFLSEPRKGLLAAEQDYLRRLAATRMGIFRIEEVCENRGLACTDLWNGERIAIREVLLTHDVVSGSVIAARPFLAADGVWELDGAIYSLTPENGDALVAILRAAFSQAPEDDPTLKKSASSNNMPRQSSIVIGSITYSSPTTRTATMRTPLMRNLLATTMSTHPFRLPETPITCSRAALAGPPARRRKQLTVKCPLMFIPLSRALTH